ncbi:hypothetical protein UFOVP54_213 [uncultured Caudovirales phage]|uniref:Uncharacterized protein n=1 Tax=uncultured Caudovirales phage TaxID=2100421 RepID=A0A6J5KTE4_9CAUD|nr:hypothetical protein UFOVP54_213 [uncultured Caudovirales phage]
MILLIFLYIIPMILTIAVIYQHSDEVTRGDLVGIVLISALPLLNFFVGYVGGLIGFCRSERVNDFFNTRIK